MRGVTPITFSFVYCDKPESPRRLADAYRRIFTHTWKNILDKQSTTKYSGIQHDKSTDAGRVSDDRGGSQDTQSDQGYALQNGTKGQNTGGEVREGVEDKLNTPSTAS